MKHSLLPFLIAVLLGFSACQKEIMEDVQATKESTETTSPTEKETKEEPKKDPSDNPTEPTTPEEPSAPTTTGSLSESSSVQLVNGDKVTLFPSTLNANYPEKPLASQTAVYNGQKFEWTAPQNSALRIVACYPQPLDYQIVDEGGKRFREVSIQEDQSSEEIFQQTQSYVAKTDAQNGDLGVLNFSSIFTELDITLESDVFSPQDLAQAKVEVLALSKAKLDLTSGVFWAEQNSEEKWISTCHREGTRFSALIMPQPIDRYYGKAWISVQIKGKTINFKAPTDIEEDGFTKQGQVVHLTLKVNAEDVSAYKNQKKWVYGVVPPQEQDWVVSEDSYHFRNVPWTNGCGWYDCKKTFSNVGFGTDYYMCASAAAASLLHWWMDHNQKYLDKFNYTGPRKFNSQLSSEIFDFFKQNYGDRGAFSFNLLQQFITGISGVETGRFFEKVFQKKSPIEVRYFHTGVNNKEKFNKFVREAIDAKKGIELGTSDHSMCLWGVEFDDEGYISHLYYADNNDRGATASSSPGIKRNAVIYKDDKVWLDDPMYTNLRQNSFIMDITTLDLGTQQWEAYFANKR